MRVAVVTDTASDVDAVELERLGVTVVPHVLQVPVRAGASCLWREDPLADAFLAAYEDRARGADAIISIHVSSRLAGAVNAARTARERMRGVLPIEVIDSGAASFALGFVVRRTA